MNVPEKPRRFRRVLVIAVLSVASIIVAGFWFASQFQSSAQQEADAQAPAPGPVFAEVTQGTLAGEVSFTGQVGPSTQTPVTVLPNAGASLSVITGRAVQAGSSVTSGQVLTEVNGRPLFGVQSLFSFYRDMGIGDQGPDVAALQKALGARSYPVIADGRFGSETASALTRWYRDSGYDVPTRVATAVAPTALDENDPPQEKATEGDATAPPREAYLPVAEIVAIPTATAQVTRGVKIGQQLAFEGQPDLILGSADLVVMISLPAADIGGVVAGDAATISINGAAFDGVVGEILAAEATEVRGDPESGTANPGEAAEATASEITLLVIPQAVLPVSTGSARVKITKQIVAQDALIVPVLAVSDRGPDKNVLTKRQDDGSLQEVPVRVLGTLQGEVAVEPVTAGGLVVGDQVRVG